MIKGLMQIFMGNQPDKNYLKSNSITRVQIPEIDLNHLFEELNFVIQSEDPLKVQEVSQRILDSLRAGTEITVPVSVSIGRKNKSKYGYVKMLKGREHKMRLFTHTYKRDKPRKAKVFLNTLLHEFVHVYDIENIKLRKTIHCKGFYDRIHHLMELFKVEN